ncbi:MAG: HlyD family efflux transporter periplasmic adaptor subunit [Prevotellaceae bacterium]|jgi:HlyD family secretion protein|nr:HlyD family efflux transporter periplasmic adaptor subunit [Prevotellaceae bacterium]
MKMNKLMTLIIVSLLISCGKNKGDYDASGAFETTEVLISSQASGMLLKLNVEEGQILTTDIAVGYVDTTQLYLKKKQLLANMRAVDSRFYNISLQIAAIKQQIDKQNIELKRFQNLLKSNAATQKQVDDIEAQIQILTKQLAAQTESLENNNKSVSNESAALQIQIEQVTDLIDKSIIASPVYGTVLAKYAEAGEIVSQGKALFKIGDTENMFLRAYITADQLTQLKLQQKVKIFADFGKNETKEYEGTITWISEKAEFTPKTIKTRNERANLVYAMKIAVKNDGYIKIGMYGEIKF